MSDSGRGSEVDVGGPPGPISPNSQLSEQAQRHNRLNIDRRKVECVVPSCAALGGLDSLLELEDPSTSAETLFAYLLTRCYPFLGCREPGRVRLGARCARNTPQYSIHLSRLESEPGPAMLMLSCSHGLAMLARSMPRQIILVLALSC
jgi:hypothetical protein